MARRPNNPPPANELEREAERADVVALRPYPIGTAARLAGLQPEVVRMWEKRYGLLAPDRTDGGHRLYSEADVGVLRAVKRLLDEGMRIGTVARLAPQRILDEAARLSPAPPPHASVLGERDRLLDDVLEAARALDTPRVTALLDRPRLLADGVDVVLEVYLPLMAKVGDLWEVGALPPAVEHFLEKLVTARLHAVLAQTPAPGTGQLALLACLPGERHEAGLLAAAILLKRAGFDVVVLGADLPIADLELAARTTAPALLLLSATVPPAPDALRDATAALARPPLAQVPCLVGGPSARLLADRLPGATVIGGLSDLVADARRVIRLPARS
jgi:MerR family transcriptional regulator, light-induced transcriptional regulator